MNNDDRPLHNAVLVLTILSTTFLVFNMVAIRICQQQVLFDRGALSGVEIIMLVGFGVVLLFDIASFFWVLLRIRQPGKPATAERALLGLAILCPFLLLADKVLVDEIARESRLRWEVLGEWIILYVFLTAQLVLNLGMLRQLLRARRD